MKAADLTAALAADDAAEDAGMHPDDRRTCHTCQTWATDEHIDSDEHRQAIGMPEWWTPPTR